MSGVVALVLNGLLLTSGATAIMSLRPKGARDERSCSDDKRVEVQEMAVAI